ncbi:DUF6176 family protein [Pseudoclavibacter sp. VKM Ac-2867]|uniref:DUF6176 family protein n=1 Tax=Pseudoclavibacter sp. VKM Ac-2867 TaxID=2783829 RepID=UPI003A5BF5BD
MPPTVPAGLRLQRSRAPIQENKEDELSEWMAVLTDRDEECVQTLPAERSAFEATFVTGR